MTRTTPVIMAAAGLALAGAGQAQDGSGYNWWTPPGDVDRRKPETLADLEAAYADLAWKTFIALNWPAEVRGVVPYPARMWMRTCRTTPVSTQRCGALGRPPRSCSSRTDRPPHQGDRRTACRPYVRQAERRRESPYYSRYRRVATYRASSYRRSAWGPVIDQNQEYTWFGIQANEAMYDYIVDNRL